MDRRSVLVGGTAVAVSTALFAEAPAAEEVGFIIYRRKVRDLLPNDIFMADDNRKYVHSFSIGDDGDGNGHCFVFDSYEQAFAVTKIKTVEEYFSRYSTLVSKVFPPDKEVFVIAQKTSKGS